MIINNDIPDTPNSHKKMKCQCDICGEIFFRMFKYITESRKRYNTEKDYCKRCCYNIRSPKKKIICRICKKSFVVGDSRANEAREYCSYECVGKGRIGYKHSARSKALMSKTGKGKVPWNKGKTSEEDNRILAGESSPSFGVTYRTKETHPEWAQKYQIRAREILILVIKME